MENNRCLWILYFHVLITNSITGQMVGIRDPKQRKKNLKDLGKKGISQNPYIPFPITVTVEVLIAVDTALYDKITQYYHNGRWDQGPHNVGHPEEEVKLYVRKFMSAVNNKFQYQFIKPKVKFHISGFIIGEPTKQFIVNPDGLDVYLTRDKMMDFFGNKTLKENYPFDVALLLTGETKFKDDVYGFAEIGRACDYRVTSIGKNVNVANVISQDLGQFSGVKTTVHQIGHMLGAHQDGLMTSADCPPEDGHIMSGVVYTEENRGTDIYQQRKAYEWSKCSVTVIINFLRANPCLFNTPDTDPYPLMEWGELAEHMPTLKQQCSIYESDDTVADVCGEDPCQYLECQKIIGYSVNFLPLVDCFVQTKQYAADGSKCDEEKFCHRGDCVAKSYWMTGQCFDTHQNPQNGGKIPLGNIPDAWDCLKYCKIFGLTGCYWQQHDGECVAHTKDVQYGSGISGQFCYKFLPDDCPRVKWGFHLPHTPNADHNVGRFEEKTIEDCTFRCKSMPPASGSCYFWSFDIDIDGVGWCDLYSKKTDEMEQEADSIFHTSKWAWGPVGSCSKDVCEKPLKHYTVAAKYTQQESPAENKQECEDKCQKPYCGRFEFTAEKKCFLIFQTAKGLIEWVSPSNIDCGLTCRRNPECLQWHSSKYKNGFDCRLYKEINKLSAKQMARPDLVVGTKYSC